VFEPVERKDVSFTGLVTKRLADDRWRWWPSAGGAKATRPVTISFGARFPDAVLPEILAEFIDRCGVEGALHREFPLAEWHADAPNPLERLAELLAPAADGS
jgi:hypothetical protein